MLRLACVGKRSWRRAGHSPMPDQLFEESDWVWAALRCATGARPSTAIRASASNTPAPRRRIHSPGRRTSRRAAMSAQTDATSELALAEANRQYEERFGRIFIVCAAGKSRRGDPRHRSTGACTTPQRMSCWRPPNSSARSRSFAFADGWEWNSNGHLHPHPRYRARPPRHRGSGLARPLAVRSWLVALRRTRPTRMAAACQLLPRARRSKPASTASASRPPPTTRRSISPGLYPYVEIAFEVRDSGQHYHIPLLLTANGYTTYRGS